MPVAQLFSFLPFSCVRTTELFTKKTLGLVNPRTSGPKEDKTLRTSGCSHSKHLRTSEPFLKLGLLVIRTSGN